MRPRAGTICRSINSVVRQAASAVSAIASKNSAATAINRPTAQPANPQPPKATSAMIPITRRSPQVNCASDNSGSDWSRNMANPSAKNPTWTSYEKLRSVIEKKMFSNTEELLPVISFNAKASADEAKKHEDFVDRMVAKGYTSKQVRLLCEWYLRVRKSS